MLLNWLDEQKFFQEDASAKCIHREQAVDALLEPLTCEENTVTQSLSAFILSNLGGTFSWTGESYTAAWLVKKSGLTSLDHKNMIRNCDFRDQSLQAGFCSSSH